jgi:hypothetical protein
MKNDFKEKWWDDINSNKNITFAELAKGLLFCAAVIAVSIVVLWVKGAYFG